MSELTKLEKQIAQLSRRAEALRNTEKKRAIAPMKAEIARLGIEPAELFPALKGVEIPAGKRSAAKPTTKAAAKAPRQPKYRDPKTGATWTGHGRAPKWLADAKKRLKGNVESLLIMNSTTASAPEAKAVAKRVTKAPAAKAKAATKGTAGAAAPGKPGAKKSQAPGKAKTSAAEAKPRAAARKPAAPKVSAKKPTKAAAKVTTSVAIDPTVAQPAKPATSPAPAA